MTYEIHGDTGCRHYVCLHAASKLLESVELLEYCSFLFKLIIILILSSYIFFFYSWSCLFSHFLISTLSFLNSFCNKLITQGDEDGERGNQYTKPYM